ncbi:MAG: formylglycine-generating enzyme family protein [Opitutales bacterium]|nr:formylglycine-generating enzyme family protein [Opitutales bacterium]
MFTKNHHKPSLRGNALVIILMIVAGAVIIGISYVSALQTGSKDRGNDTRYTNEVNGEVAHAAKLESERLERKFNSIQEYKKDKITMEDIDIYEQAITEYEKYLANSNIDRSVNARADKMRKRLHNMRAMLIRERTLVLEEEGEKLVDQKKFAAAEKKFREAYGLEKRIDTQYTLADLRNAARTQLLFYRMQAMQAIPMTDRANRLEKEGDDALKEKNWARAGLKYKESLKIFQRLNGEFYMISFNNGASVTRLNRKVATVASSPYQERLENYIADAEKCEAEQNWAGALDFRQKAYDEYRRLETNFPRSNFVSEETQHQLQTDVANASARPQYENLMQVVEQLSQAIKNDDYNKTTALARNAAVISQSIIQDFPGATLLSKDLVQVLAFIDISSPVIEQIRISVKKSLKTIPGVPETKQMMADKEVSQALFQAVTQKNPSADQSNPLAPVESLSFFDAQNFCRLLSILYCYEVRLPDKEEYLAARGQIPSNETVLDQAWLTENSNEKIHPVGNRNANENGYFDLIGNVGEWLGDNLYEASGTINPDSGEINAYVAGGDYLTPLEFLRIEPVSKAPKNDRSRQRGFRFIVDFEKPVDFNKIKID